MEQESEVGWSENGMFMQLPTRRTQWLVGCRIIGFLRAHAQPGSGGVVIIHGREFEDSRYIYRRSDGSRGHDNLVPYVWHARQERVVDGGLWLVLCASVVAVFEQLPPVRTGAFPGGIYLRLDSP